MCFICLKKGHMSRNCVFSKKCGIDGCRMKHHKMLHGSHRVRPHGGDQRVIAAVTGNRPAEGMTLLQIVPVRVHGQDGRFRDTLALLDPGSQTSLCSEAIIRDVKISGEAQSLCIENVEGRGSTKRSERVQLTLSPLCEGQDVDRKILVPEAFSVPRVNVRAQHIPKRLKDDWKHLQGINIPDCSQGTVEVLLGANVLEAVLQREAKVGRAGEPVAVRTAFGWTLTGTIAGFVPPQTREVMFIHRADTEDRHLGECVEEWWKTDSFGTKVELKGEASAEDLRALRLLDTSVKKCGDRYEAGLLWKGKDQRMPDNRASAMRRLQSLEKGLLRNPEKAKAYEAELQAYVEAGHARKLSQEEADQRLKKRWLLPHHAVVNPNKPKLRVVFDAAATHLGVSLNSELMKGPDMLQNLVGILLRFREEQTAMVADIKKMFHQIRIRQEDQPALSFWWRNLDTTRQPDMYQMQVAIFGAKCSPAIANFVLQRAAEDGCTGTEESTAAKKAVQTSFYMDDFVKSECSSEAALNMKREVSSILAKGGFCLTKWMSNEERVLAEVPVDERAVLKIDSSGKSYCSVLGCKWTPQDDYLAVKCSVVAVPPTKRGILKQVASMFDPLGIVAPYTLVAKKLIQSLWERKLGWDEGITGETLHIWRRWQEELQHVEDACVPRWYGAPEQEVDAQYELHMFSDASELAFGTVAYIRVLSSGYYHSRFVMARTRLAPLRQLSIVRLELQGAVMSTRVASLIKREMNYNFKRIVFWTDSQVVLQFLKNESRRYHTFVANRVSEIHDTTSPDQWRFVPGSENPADLCSRGKSLSELKNQQEWWLGPAFLESKEEHWPPQEDVGDISPDCVEVKRSAAICATSHASSPKEEITSLLSQLIDPARFSSWTRYRRIVAWIRRFISNVKSKVAGTEVIDGPLRSAEIDAAEISIIKDDQETCMKQASLDHLSPFRDQHGLMRVGGRLSKTSLDEYTKHPVILDAKSEITRLVIVDAHQRVMHWGLERTLCELRSKYWVQRMRSAVKKHLWKCAFCRNRRASPQPPRMADLPEARLDMRRPFSTVGLDFFGPLTVKKFRKTEKRYVLLITCLATRAIHLELAALMDTSSFIMALRRFIARRGRPRTIYSDNGTNLVGGERELREAIEHWNQAQISDALSQRNIQWVFIPPAAPHMGGAWERLIASVKRSLKVVLGNKCVSEDVLQTTLAEVEFMINGRPLTYISSDPQDPEPLTPNHFLLGSSDGREGLPPGVFNDADADVVGRRRWQQVQILAEHLWKRWLKEYLPTLINRQKWKTEKKNLQIDDVVLVVNSQSPRGYWELGRITRVYPGSDGGVRSAEVKTKSGTYVRPTTKLCLLESLN
ncbi:uncharacterized protein LOC122386061 [Amphibalanus amphitrite]|nr:uncharacterized protein LOC122386061 [Amphibalanus amphitrite]